MSSDTSNQSRRALLLVSLGLVTALAGCQVRPLYSEDKSTRRMLASISFSAAKDRVGQEVRNRLIFLAAGGQGEPAHPEYLVDMNVQTQSQDVLYDSSADKATAGRVTVSADYTLKKATDGSVLRIAHRQSVALLDLPTQEFAKLRAKRDAEDRAAHELAELISADLAAVLAK
ncbi:LPS assembly lipoprotein LptE [Allorhizobium undicola]|uniref:LPS assembly lipoprotein LptE n=1 Tax=Allorhizobium undicola TaxID=78527 RepID=UPI00048511B0|nr:LPS assembly lipoprotein LptE [Allorhizobium undicola]